MFDSVLHPPSSGYQSQECEERGCETRTVITPLHGPGTLNYLAVINSLYGTSAPCVYGYVITGRDVCRQSRVNDTGDAERLISAEVLLRAFVNLGGRSF